MVVENFYNSKEEKLTDSVFELPFKKYRDDLKELSDYVKFVKASENLCKKHPDYTLIIDTIRDTQPHCQFLGNLTKEDVEIQVHHNCLTHFDICAIITNALLNRGEYVTTAKVAKLDLEEHKKEHVQLVCLSKTAHQAIDTGEIFINLNQGIGNLSEFIKDWRDGIDEIYRDKLNTYIDMSKKFKSTDGSILELSKDLIHWGYRD